METLNLRLDSVHGASEETLNAWYAEARRDWPSGMAARMMDAIRKEAARRKAA
jgi:DNA-binding transcriptional regulator YiaG